MVELADVEGGLPQHEFNGEAGCQTQHSHLSSRWCPSIQKPMPRQHPAFAPSCSGVPVTSAPVQKPMPRRCTASSSGVPGTGSDVPTRVKLLRRVPTPPDASLIDCVSPESRGRSRSDGGLPAAGSSVRSGVAAMRAASEVRADFECRVQADATPVTSPEWDMERAWQCPRCRGM